MKRFTQGKRSGVWRLGLGIIIVAAIFLQIPVVPAAAHPDGGFPYHQNFAPQCRQDVGFNQIFLTAPNPLHGWNNDSTVIGPGTTADFFSDMKHIWWTTGIGWYDANGAWNFRWRPEMDGIAGWMRKYSGSNWEHYENGIGWRFGSPMGTATMGFNVNPGASTYYLWSALYWEAAPSAGIHVEYLGACTFAASASSADRRAPGEIPAAEPSSASSKRADKPNRPSRLKERCTIRGTKGNDVLKGTKQPDVICGLGGNDRIRAGKGDSVLGGRGNDSVRSRGAAFTNGGPGRDSIRARNGRYDVIVGGRGRDRASFDRKDRGNGSVEARI